MITNAQPTSYDDVEDLKRFNMLLDAITAKRFLSPTIFAQAVRGACDLHGIVLPLLDIEGGNGATVEDGKFILARVSDPTNPDMYAPPFECEHIFNVLSHDGEVADLHLYIVCDRDEKGLYDCYAQVVDHDDLQDLLNVDEKDFPELVGGISGETEYLQQTRHSRGDVVDDTPPQE